MKSTKIIAVITLCLIVLSVFISLASVIGEDKILPIPHKDSGRYILWTSDGVHVLWGNYKCEYRLESDNACILGTFSGQDNEGKKVTGTFDKGIFKGTYDGNKVFYGKYTKNIWKAEGLFGLKRASGEFKVFPQKPIIIQK